MHHSSSLLELVLGDLVSSRKSKRFCRKTTAPPSLSTLLAINEASKQSYINLGYPPAVGQMFNELFGSNAAIVARWFKDNSLLGKESIASKDWFHKERNLSKMDDLSLYVTLYEALLTRNDEHYNKAREDLGLYVDPNEPIDYDRLIPGMKKGIEKSFLGTTFCGMNIIKDILSGKLQDLKPYARKTFSQANRAYEDKLLFHNTGTVAGVGHMLKRYPDGTVWVNAGSKCRLVGDDMSNCGSTGLMSLDSNSTMYVLYDKKKIAHAIFTLSPQDGNRISGVQGKGSTELKPEYNQYVLDAVKELDGWLDLYGSGTLNHELTLRYRLGDSLLALDKVGSSGNYTTYRMTVRLPGGKDVTVYTNGYSVLPLTDIQNQKYAGYLVGSEMESDDAKAMKLMTLSGNGGMYTSDLPRIRQWMNSVGIQEPESRK